LEKEGLPLLILIRIAPYPYPIFNALFAATRVQFHIYAIGTAVALIKVRRERAQSLLEVCVRACVRARVRAAHLDHTSRS
jgi:hypothetical protein